ncbi:MAG: TonB-dependent receptor, partial [Cyclobacteriaceae bacterium]|nr:TonB-dependent receptor [Cyclobacteriaceae bacterium]
MGKQADVKIFNAFDELDTMRISIDVHDISLTEAFNTTIKPLGYTLINYDSYNYILERNISPLFTLYENTTEGSNILEIGKETDNPSKSAINLSGYIQDAKTGETIIGALIRVMDIDKGAVSNTFGHYSLDVPYGTHELKISFIGYEDEIITINALSPGSLNVEIFEGSLELEEIVVTSEAEDINISNAQPGITKLSIQTIKNIPAFFGEVDVVKTMILLPGVSTAGEGASGFNVRGGDVGQNLILLDDAIIFNSSHLFGFFSVFHPDLVKDVTLYKGGIPSNFGGRLSSVMDVRLKDGNTKEFTAKGGIGLLSGKLSMEGPINDGKGSFVLGGRKSYLNWLLRKSKNLDLMSSAGGFYDLTGKAN